MKYKVGDRVKVVNRFKGHLFKIGDIVTITEEYPEDLLPYYRADNEYDYWFLNDDEIELYEEKKMTKYTTEPIDYTECHPVIAEHLKRGEAILCRVREYKHSIPVVAYVQAYIKKFTWRYTTISLDGEYTTCMYAEPIPVKRKVLMSAEKAVVKLIENGSKIDSAGCINVESAGDYFIYLSNLKDLEGKEKEKVPPVYPDYLFEEVDD